MHTKEQWELIAGYSGLIFHEEQCIARCCEPQSYANARRIVACVNACAGIPTVDLELDNVLFTEALRERISLKKQRDELLAALKDARRALASASANNSLYSGAYEDVDEAIKKVGLTQ